jgi:hypothetical protein
MRDRVHFGRLAGDMLRNNKKQKVKNIYSLPFLAIILRPERGRSPDHVLSAKITFTFSNLSSLSHTLILCRSLNIEKLDFEVCDHTYVKGGIYYIRRSE